MDASNEFKVLLRPSSGSVAKGKKPEGDGGSGGVRQRLVPVINKVFSPSHFMLAQRKTTVYKAVSGVSFQDIDVGGKKRSGSKKDKRSSDKKTEESSVSEGERSLLSTKSDKSVRSLLSGKESKMDVRRQRHSLGSHADRGSFLHDNAEKLGLSGKKSRGNSAMRTRSVSATDNLYLAHSDVPPIKPQRSRSASRLRKSESKVSVPSNTNTNASHNSESSVKQNESQENNKNSKKKDSDTEDESQKDSTERKESMADENTSVGRSRTRKKPESSKSECCNDGKKCEKVEIPKDASEKDIEEKEGGYFSLEKEEKTGGEMKFIYEALPNSSEEYAESDQCVETIYVCQVFKKESDSEDDEDHIYENYQVIKMTKEGKLIDDDDENYENYQIIRRIKEADILRNPGELHSDDDDEIYENINFISQTHQAFTPMTASQAREKRHNPLGSNDSIPFIDDSDNSVDEVEKDDVNNDDPTKGSITVITINDNNAKITRKQSPQRTKPQQLRSQDGLVEKTDSKLTEAKLKEMGKKASHSDVTVSITTDAGITSEKGKQSTLSSGVHTSSSEASTLDGLPNSSVRHSYPAASALIPKLCDKISRNIARLGSVSDGNSNALFNKDIGKVELKVKKSTSSIDVQGRKSLNAIDDKVKKSMSHNDVESHLKGRGSRINVLSESFSDEDIRQNEDFESFSETDSELDNLDYDMFTPKSGKSNVGRKSPMKGNKPRGRSLSASHASPLMTSTPCGTAKTLQGLSSAGSLHDVAGEVLTSTTFKDLLDNRCLNPPETDTESQAGEGSKEDNLVIQEDTDVVGNVHRSAGTSSVSRNGVVAYRGRSGAEGEQIIFDDTLSFTWSDAESEFEFIDFKKAEPPKTCVVYQGVTVACDVTSVTTSVTAVTTATTKTEKKLSTPVKRSHSMKVVGERLSCRGEGNLRWEPLLCVLPEGLTTTHGGGLVRSVSGVSIRRSVRVDGSRYTAASPDTSDVILKSYVDSKGGLGGAHLKHDRSSAPSSPQLAASRSAESTPSKYNFFPRLNKKNKSGSKPEKKTSRNEEGTTEINDGSLRSARSHESLQTAACTHPQDPVHHPSPLHDRARNQVNRDETRRTENTLMIWIMEAKGIPSKKKYFCNLKLNNELYRRTCSKQMTNMCFWGEYFELDSLPQVSTICIELMREKKPGSKRIGSVIINVTLSSPGRAALTEDWYNVTVEKQEREIPSIRIKHKFQSLDILPLPKYIDLRAYLKDNSTSLCRLLEPAVSVKAKEDIATTLIHIMQAEQRAITFLVNLILIETQKKAENEHLLFRGNSVATKAIEAYMKLVGEQYLQETLLEPIQSLIANPEDLEVDPQRIPNLQSLPRQREALKDRVTEIWEKIIQSSTNFPVELRKVFHTLREHLSHQGKIEMTDNLISACVFLRFLCPAVLSPSLFSITQEYPDEGIVRNLTLITKTLQTLANFTHFQGKENFMEFLNEFIDKEQAHCRTFLRTISSSPNEDENELEFAGEIDLGKHLALLHLHLIEALAKINTQGYESEASKVLALVDDISTLLGEGCKDMQSASRQISTQSPISTPPLVSNPSVMATPTHLNNNYVRDYDGHLGVDMFVGGMGVGFGIPPTGGRSQSLPRTAAPVYHHHIENASPGINSPYREKTAANDLSTNDDYVLITAFDHPAQPQNFMYPSMEANNNATVTDVRLSNGNSYYMAEVVPPESPICSSVSPAPHYTSGVQPSLRAYPLNPSHPRRHPRAITTTSRSHSVTGILSPLERRGPYENEISDLHSYMDSCSHQIDALCMDHENNIQGSQTSISQLSNVASSGYQSFAYSQSSSPVDSLLQTDNSSLLSRDNGNPGQPILRQVLHGSPLASPLHQPAVGKHRAVAVHPAYLGHAGHVSLHGTPRHIPRVPQSKGSPNSSLSSSQSVEDLSSLRRGRTRQRRSASSSSDSSPESRPAMHAHSRRSNVHPPRTNPHCSPRLIPSPALRQELRSRSRCDRNISGRRGKIIRSCDREDLTRGTSHCYEDSEDDISGASHVSGGAGGGSWRKDGRRLSQDDYQVKSNVAPQQILEQQEDQMRAIVERLMSMEHEFRHEQEIMWKEMQHKDARIDAQAKKIAALDCANTKLIQTIATLGTRPEETKPEMPEDPNVDSCNASDTSDYKSSSC